MATGLTFVSYSRNDSEFAVRLASDLRARGAEVWVDQLDIEAGARWDTAVEGALKRSARLLVLLSPQSVGSQNVLDEVSFALDEGKTVLPVLVEPCAIPMRMRRLQHVDFTRGYEPGLTRLLTSLGVAQPGPSAPPASAERETPPPRPEPAPAAREPEPEVAPGAEPEVFRPAPHTSRVVPLAAAGVGLAIAAVVWFSSRGPTVTADPSSESTTAPAEQTTPQAAAPAAPADQRSDAPAATPPVANDSASTPTNLRRAPVGTSVSALLESLNGRTAAPAADAKGDQGLEALRTLTRQFGARTTLDAADLNQVVSAERAACPNQAPTSPCSTAANDLVQSMLTTVCHRQIGERPQPGDEKAVLSWDIKMLGCRQPYTKILLDRMNEDAKSAIRRIRAD